MSAECRGIRSLLDSHLSDELPPEQRASVERHVAGCGTCGAELERRRQLRRELAAILDVGEVPALESRILAAVEREHRAGSRKRRLGWGAAVAASLAAVLIAVRFMPPRGTPSEADETLYEGARKAHLICAVRGDYPAPLPPEKAPQRLAGYAALGAAIEPELSQGATLLEAHVCSWPQRYGHVILQRGEHRVSVLVTARPPGSLPKDGPVTPANARIRTWDRAGFRLAEAEANDYAAFVVSDLDASELGAMSLRILPSVVRAFRSDPD